MGEYTDTTYGTTRFHILEGLYSIEEIEKLLVNMKADKKKTEKSLKRAIMNRIEEDDDIQDYKKPWVGLTIEEIEKIAKPYIEKDRSIQSWGLYAVAIEAKLKEKNA